MPRNKGLTLVEILLAAAILVTAFTGILSFNAQYLKSLESTRNFSVAVNAALERLEKIKARTNPSDETLKIDFDQLTQYNNSEFDIYAADNTTVLPNFKGISYVQAAMTQPITMYRVKVLVWWTEVDGKTIGSKTASPVSLQTTIMNMG
ncbi:MAG: hypothetical protein MUC39_01390 [Candidatus Omnitrophica bacterium]|jgi:Tfp pilus assembly protein PilV|nr:hypothetical protein [Candidatus Omnitrophota bacterium]